jgi:hypothetical protein
MTAKYIIPSDLTKTFSVRKRMEEEVKKNIPKLSFLLIEITIRYSIIATKLKSPKIPAAVAKKRYWL